MTQDIIMPWKFPILQLWVALMAVKPLSSRLTIENDLVDLHNKQIIFEHTIYLQFTLEMT